jgi:hypothetical protein
MKWPWTVQLDRIEATGLEVRDLLRHLIAVLGEIERVTARLKAGTDTLKHAEEAQPHDS